jgi:RimJ/RimL family protein N-acetyltransferase
METNSIYMWNDYDPKIHTEIDKWCEQQAIREFACDNLWNEEWAYYCSNPEYHPGEDVFCKIIYANNIPVAAMIIFCNPQYPLVINPIIVNPNEQNKGHGTRIFQEIINNGDKLFPKHSGTIEVGCNLNNAPILRVMEKCNFEMSRLHSDGDFAIFSHSL